MWKGIAYVLIILSLSTLCSLIGFSRPQVLSLSIFFMVIFGTILFWRFRLSFTLIGIFFLLFFGLLDIPHLIEFAGLDIILFLIGMMILVGYLEENYFFESLVDTLTRYVGPRPLLLLVALMAAGAVSAALVDEVTSILFMTATMIHLTSRFGVNPIPFMIIQVFATNIGSSATVVGNPIGVMIAMRAGLTFQDFLRVATPISLCPFCLLFRFHFSITGKRFGNGDRGLKVRIRGDVRHHRNKILINGSSAWLFSLERLQDWSSMRGWKNFSDYRKIRS